jgi:hypothetical protein
MEFRPQDGPALPRSVVEARRHQRKADRLREQRDHWKAEHDKLAEFLRTFPFFRIERERYDSALKERARVKALEARCHEQALLIEKLTKPGDLKVVDIS